MPSNFHWEFIKKKKGLSSVSGQSKLNIFTVNYLTASGQDKRRKVTALFKKHINSILQHSYEVFPHTEKGHKADQVNTCRVTSTVGCIIRGSVTCSKDVPLYSALTRLHLEHEVQMTLSPSVQERIKIN